MNTSYQPSGKSINYCIEKFLTYTANRQKATINYITQIFFFASIEAVKSVFGFGKGDRKKATKAHFDRVTIVRHSTEWGGKQDSFKMSPSTMRSIRDDLEAAGFFKVVGVGFGEGVKKVKGKPKSPITALTDIDLEGLAMLARTLMCALIERVTWEKLKSEKWGALASIVRTLTGFSVFSMDENVPDKSPEERQAAKRLDFDRYTVEFQNAWGLPQHRENIRRVMVEKFGVGWVAELPY
jgi:hypothetical protein